MHFKQIGSCLVHRFYYLFSCCLQQLWQAIMYDKINRKRLNTEILTKTEVALQAIKRHDVMEQSMLNFNLTSFNASKTLLNQLDHDYSKLTPHKLIVLDHTYKLSLLTYSQEFYNLQMINCIFPMRVLLKNVKNEATIYVGYDQQYPGIYQYKHMSIFSEENLTKEKNYDFKANISQDMIIVLKNKGNKQIRNVYFTIDAGKSIFLSDFKVEFLGVARDRVHSQVKLATQSKYEMNSQKKKIQTSMPTLQRTKTQTPQMIGKLREIGIKNLKQIMSRTVKLQDLMVFNSDIKKHNSKSNLEQNLFKRTDKRTVQQMKTKDLFFGDKNNKYRATNAGSLNGQKKVMKTEVDYKIQQAKRNKEMINQYKQKDKQLKQTASKCKKMIEDYKKIYNQQDVRKRKLNKDIAISLYSAIFIKHVFLLSSDNMKKQKLAFRKNYLCHKFVKKIKNALQNSCNMVPFRAKRLVNEGNSGIYIFSKMISKQSKNKAQKVIKQTIDYLYPVLLVRLTILASNNYRSSIKLIQKTWKQKYHSRIRSILYFIDNHLQKMFKQLPHLKMFSQIFYTTNSNRTICLNYIKDQSEKYRFIYQAYLHKIFEINEMIVANNSFKKKLDIPKKPIRPMHRFYRNLDILKSMVRTWFEIEYKKFIKKSNKRLYY